MPFGRRVTHAARKLGVRRRVVTLATGLAMTCGAALARADEAGLIIETGSPDALCPELSSTRAAVGRRLGALTLPDGSSGYRARYTIGHAPVGSPRDFVRLELFGPEGTLQLSRDLPLEGESCSTMAEVIALVLDRFFRALAGESEEPAAAAGAPAARAAGAEQPASAGLQAPAGSQAPAGAGRASAGTAPLSTAAAAGAAEVESIAATRAAPTHLSLMAFEVAFRDPMQPALGVRAMLEPWSGLYLGAALHVGLMSEGEDLADGGRVSSRDATSRAYVAWGPRIGPVRAYLGPGFRLGLSRGSGENLERGDVGYRVTAAAGLDAGAIWVTDEGWCFAASAALDMAFPELGGRFYIDRQEVLALKPLRGWMGMAVGYAF